MAGKSVLITGCSTGIGRLSALTFQKQGWNVMATMRSPERETELTGLDSVVVARLDVTDPESITAAVDTAIREFGEIDVLVNNAGRGGRALLEQTSDEKIRSMFETNVFGLMRVTRAVLPHMRRQGRGCVINVTSMAGLLGLAAESNYCAAKYAAEGFTESLSWECKPLGILVKSVAPGVYRQTAFPSNVDDEEMSLGGEALVAHAARLRAHFSAGASRQGGDTADPQEVADKIFECATTDTPVRNPVGRDAQMIMGMMGGPDRQEFLDQVEPLLIPPS
ncbi:MAG: short-chain dehydrogenase [Deltaproteobacteria bacterium]|nr:short-chain dehydrogenase [Deltaproteobacteria bacterium]